MRVDGRKYTFEHREDLNNPTIIGIKFSNLYREHPDGNRGLVLIGFQKPNDPNWWDAEIPWDWLPKEVQMNVRKVPDA